MDIFSTHLFDWLVLSALILGGFYTLKVIGNEKTSFQQDSYEVHFANLKLMIPNWWTITDHKDLCLKFERTDTRYDWYALFQYIPDHEGKDLTALLEEKLNLEKLEFDEDVVFETDSRVVFRDSEISEHFQEMIRVEGKASQDVVDRVYYDVYLMRGLEDKGYFIFESRSSVLNGLVEGPYFEESLAELSFLKEA
jgi:hypothetical protein